MSNSSQIILKLWEQKKFQDLCFYIQSISQYFSKVQFKKPSAFVIDKDLINQAEKKLLVGIREL